MTHEQAKRWVIRHLDRNDPVMFSHHFLAMTGQVEQPSPGDVVCYDGEKFEVVEVHCGAQIVETRRI